MKGLVCNMAISNSKFSSRKFLDGFLQGVQNVHFIGIGGSGMISLVQILHQLGLKITGSDLNESDPLRLARELGVEVANKQVAQNIKNPNLIIYTSAILQSNPELVKAKSSKIPLMERNDVLGQLTNCFSNCVCVSGTHGKTTTTGMIIEILKHNKIDLSAAIGGNLKSIGGYGKLGTDDILVCEACEFANHFLKLHPTHSLILNIEPDHMEYFKTIENLKNSFQQFCEITSHRIIYYGDSADVSDVVEKARFKGQEKWSFGFEQRNDFVLKNVEQIEANRFRFQLNCFGKPVKEIFEICIPGRHNVLNAAGAIAACYNYGDGGLSFESIAQGLKQFKGVKRRFEFVGKVKGITVVDDYAHHPNEIMATLKAAKSFGFKKIWAIHQPFTYSRTQMFLNAFAEALQIADRVVLTEILGSREENLTGIKSEDLAAKIEGSCCFKTQEEAADFVLKNAQPGDLAITLGCGDIYKCADIMVFGKY